MNPSRERRVPLVALPRLSRVRSTGRSLGKRCDHGGMRWIKERVEAIVQLRCIEANGDWDRFIDFVHDRMRADALREGTRLRLQSSTPAALPALLEAA